MTFDQSASGERLDRALAAALPTLTRSRVKALIESRRVALADGRTIEEPSRKVKTGERFIVDIPEPEPAEPKAQAIDLDILYEDSDLLVLNKPAGLVVHPAPGNPDNTLVNALLAHCGDSLSGIGGVRRPGIVHRLDKDTSGVMVVAKNDSQPPGARPSCSRPTTSPASTRRWSGAAPKAQKGTIEAAIGRHPVDRKRMAVRTDQRPAWPSPTTGSSAASGRRWRPLPACWAPSSGPAAPTRSASISPISAARWSATRSTAGSPATPPRPHSLRTFGRQALHAAVLEFRHPRTGKEMRFATELPQDIRRLVAELNSVK